VAGPGRSAASTRAGDPCRHDHPAGAVIFGNAFFAVVSSTASFARLNYPPAAWPKAIAMMTISFGVGQTLGPIATGAITDAVGSLSYALSISAAVLVAGVLACMAHTVFRGTVAGEAAPLQPTPAPSAGSANGSSGNMDFRAIPRARCEKMSPAFGGSRRHVTSSREPKSLGAFNTRPDTKSGRTRAIALNLARVLTDELYSMKPNLERETNADQ
jgi:MFS family permease